MTYGGSCHLRPGEERDLARVRAQSTKSWVRPFLLPCRPETQPLDGEPTVTAIATEQVQRSRRSDRHGTVAGFLRANPFVVITTVDAQGQLHSLPATVHQEGFDGELEFEVPADEPFLQQVSSRAATTVTAIDPIARRCLTLHAMARVTRRSPVLRLWRTEEPPPALLTLIACSADLWD